MNQIIRVPIVHIFINVLHGGCVSYVIYVARSLTLLHLIRRGPAQRPQTPPLHYIAGRPNIPEKRDSRYPWHRLKFRQDNGQ